jgi:hypothetical protein
MPFGVLIDGRLEPIEQERFDVRSMARASALVPTPDRAPRSRPGPFDMTGSKTPRDA